MEKLPTTTLSFKGREKTVALKTKWLKTFPKRDFYHQKTCDEIGISKSRFYQWKINDDKFTDEYTKIYNEAIAKGLVTPQKKIRKRSPETVLNLKKKFLKLHTKMTLKRKEVCTVLEISEQIFKEWIRDDGDFKKKYDRLVSKKRGDTFRKTLSNGVSIALKKTHKEGTRLRKKRQENWLIAYKSSYFNVGFACTSVGITRQTFYLWKKKHPKFLETFMNATEEKKDFIEDRLMKNIDAGDSSCLIFAAKTQLKDRGYIEKQEIEHSGNFGVMVIPGKIEDANDWAMKAQKQQQLLKEKSIETDYINELQE